MLRRSAPEQRKRVRKGTKSCWECKRRKVKCIPTSDRSTCTGCQERRTPCRRQEYVDDDPSHEASLMARRMARVESLLEMLMERIQVPDGHVGSSTVLGPEVTVTANSPRPSAYPSSPSSVHPETMDPPNRKLEELRRDLEALVPCQAEIDSLFASSYGWWLIQQHMMPYLPDQVDHDADESLNVQLVLQGHPMKTTRLLLCIALAIQQLPPGVSALNLPPGEPLREKMNSLSAFVVQVVLSDDEMIGNMEGVESLALQGLYEVNAGNLRRALLAFRKAISIAQLLGLHRVAYRTDVKKKKDHYLWYQISRGERYLSTILGVPSSTTSTALPFDHDANWLSPEDRYHRQLYYISGLILARNQGEEAYSFSTTQRIGEEFDLLTSQMPPDLWDIPTEFLNTRTKEASAQFERVMCQVWHYELVTLLHLPFMLRAATDRRYEYSRVSCLDASRHLIRRWIAIRESRTSLLLSELLDFQAFTAATTLLLGLLGTAASIDANVMRERRADLELIDMVVQNFERSEQDDGTGKSVSAQSILVIRTLQKFLNGRDYRAQIRIDIPFFGAIQVARGAVQPVEGERLLGANRLQQPCISQILPNAASVGIETALIIPASRSLEREEASLEIDAYEGSYIDNNVSLGGNNTFLQFFDNHFQFPEASGSQGGHAEWPLEDSDIMFFDSLVNTDLIGNWSF